MPGQQLQTSAFILSRQPSGSDSFEQIVAFGEDHGLLRCLRRFGKKAGVTSVSPDLFDEAELSLESSNQGQTWFIKEYRLLQRPDGISRSYEALQAASALSGLILHNPVPDESRAAATGLLRSGFGALAAGGRPDVIWFKSLFCLLRDEGYPVRQQWWTQLDAASQDAAAKILNQPVAGQQPVSATVTRLVRHLEDWIHAETEIKIR
jgi:hypothetical protein